MSQRQDPGLRARTWKEYGEQERRRREEWRLNGFGFGRLVWIITLGVLFAELVKMLGALLVATVAGSR